MECIFWNIFRLHDKLNTYNQSIIKAIDEKFKYGAENSSIKPMQKNKFMVQI